MLDSIGPKSTFGPLLPDGTGRCWGTEMGGTGLVVPVPGPCVHQEGLWPASLLEPPWAQLSCDHLGGPTLLICFLETAVHSPDGPQDVANGHANMPGTLASGPLKAPEGW